MNGSEKMSSEAPLWMLQHRIECDRLRLVAFLLTSHGVEPERAQPLSQIEPTLGIGKTVSTLLEFLLVCLHATLELFCILGRR